MASTTNYLGETVELTENPDKVTSGKVVETFSVSVKDEDATVYKNDSEPFEWTKAGNIAEVIEAHGGKLTDEAIAFLGEVFTGEDNGKAVANIIEQHNDVTRASAKNNAYQRVVNNKKPMSQDDKEKAFKRMVEMFSKLNNITIEAAAAKLKAMQG